MALLEWGNVISSILQSQIAFYSTKPTQGLHMLEKCLNRKSFLEKSLKTKSALKSTGEPLQGIEKSLNFSIFCRTTLLMET